MITNIIVCDRIPKLSMLRFSHNISIAFLRLFTGCITYSGSLLKLLYLFCLIVSIYIQDFLEEKGIISEKESENAIFPAKEKKQAFQVPTFCFPVRQNVCYPARPEKAQSVWFEKPVFFII